MAGPEIGINEYKGKERHTDCNSSKSSERDLRNRNQGRKMETKWEKGELEKEERSTHMDRQSFK